MIKSFNLFEAQARFNAGGNLFSNNHRSPNLPPNCTMVDVDNILIEYPLKNNKISGIVEDKYTFESIRLGNPLEGKGTWQRKKLSEICNRLLIDFYLVETSTDSKYLVKGETVEKVDSIPGKIIKTDDRIYIEIRFGKPKAIMFRTIGMKITELEYDDKFNLALSFSKMLGVDIYLVNDIRPDNLIYIMNLSNKNTYSIIPDEPDSWVKTYKTLRLL